MLCSSSCFDGGCYSSNSNNNTSNVSLDVSFERRVEATNTLNQSDILQEQELQAIHAVTEEALFGERLLDLDTTTPTIPTVVDDDGGAATDATDDAATDCRTISFQRDENANAEPLLHISLLETSIIEGGEEVTYVENNFLNRSSFIMDTSSIMEEKEEEDEEKTTESNNNNILNHSISETSILPQEELLNRTISQLVQKQCFGESTVRLNERHCVRIAVVPATRREKPPAPAAKEEDVKKDRGSQEGNVIQRMFHEYKEITLDDFALCCDCTQIRKEIKEEGFASLLKNWSCLTCDVRYCQ